MREEAEIEAARRRQDATADAESELEMAKQQGRDMVNEARAYRERVLNELARRREIARQQIEQLVHGRDRLLQAFERSRLVAVDVMAELTPLGEPTEYVDLSPTTGPVPLMLPNTPRPGTEPEVAADDATTMLVRTETVETIQVIETDDGVEVIETIDTVETVEMFEAVDDEPVDDRPDAVVLDISPSEHRTHVDDPDREPGQVVALFDADDDPDDLPESTDDTVALRTSADDLFARLRAARAQSVADKAIDAGEAEAEAALAESAAAAPDAMPTRCPRRLRRHRSAKTRCSWPLPTLRRSRWSSTTRPSPGATRRSPRSSLLLPAS